MGVDLDDSLVGGLFIGLIVGLRQILQPTISTQRTIPNHGIEMTRRVVAQVGIIGGFNGGAGRVVSSVDWNLE